MTKWHSAHQGGKEECFDPGQRFISFGRGQGSHQFGWGDNGCHDGGGWGGGWGGGGGWSGIQGCDDGPRWSGIQDCNDGPRWGGGQECHDGPRGLISFDHNSFLSCH
ncbi:hypothetical protein GCM10010172_12930 [Paractinoplanes ferrugineus]|uniref:Uncharacterized protein n=1 Tax=Paractinoplanes ferrugineus TaxID=113564 RepID=A0A919MBM0_9ACTN|nr:hypothetical protein [Actinoplanes ferrugineus]GIE09858.1 hypothetical protein Afe05nite_16980 [Actinoplanes ferrugineus]